MNKKQKTFPINPQILKWARDEAGFTLAEAAQYAQIKPVKQSKKNIGLSAPEHLNAIENGTKNISKVILEKLSKLYRRPIITFFLPSPPPKNDFFVDYRATLTTAKTDSPSFQALKRRIYNLYQELLAIAKDNGQAPYPFIGSCGKTRKKENLLTFIEKYFGLNPRKTIRKQLTPDALFRKLREQAQDAGVYVILQGNLGSHHTKIDVEEFRGMAISDKLAPIIIINSNDSDSAKSFTLIHELCHLLLGINVLGNYDVNIPTSNKIEKLCNAVAADYLVPKDELLNIYQVNASADDYFTYGKFFGVSSLVIARRLFDLGIISKEEYLQHQALIASKVNKKKLANPNSGPNPNTVLKSYLGKKLLNTLDNAVNNGQLAPSDLTSILHIPFSRFEKVVQ